MLMETQAQQLVATVLSQPKPLDGQKNRSSGNFSTESLPSGTQYLKWEVEGGGNPDLVSFNVMKDVSAGTDPVVFHDVLSGNRTSVVSARSLYIANPKNASEPFTVSVYAIY
ncbi:DeoR family transcriptional regulator [Bacillus thuringiensis]|nr:Phosphatidylinositol-specific phospholipase [Bacillus thuringiensis MC28]MBZ8125557.1 DeoR family transcriptional regulator [Bacillus thuringiensis]TKH47416.1 DeoR family transcriptional regulator [Bacillus cereus]PFQ70918.1 DeoR family transcriptional regulator [Bacillus thuringiensis]PGK64591.1 DeoR family transcriptional regulator [Bacillus thuringiensis]